MTIKQSVLNVLEENRGGYISGEKLSGDLGVSRAAVWKAINSLRGEGYRIEAVTNRGYLLAGDEEKISEKEIRKYLPKRYRKNTIYLYDVAGSTNTEARNMDCENGSIVIARQQTSGRGRLGRSFFSPREGIYMSVVISPDFDMSKSIKITVAAAAAVAEAIDEVCLQEPQGQNKNTEIKWVNDIYLCDKKVCGILTEGITDFESGSIEKLIIGIGINTSNEGFPEELKDIAGSVEGDWSRSKLIAEITTRILDYAEEMNEAKDRSFMETYRKKNMLKDREVTVFKGAYRKDPREEIEGENARVIDVDDEGGLIIVYDDGKKETLTTGEVSIRAYDR